MLGSGDGESDLFKALQLSLQCVDVGECKTTTGLMEAKAIEYKPDGLAESVNDVDAGGMDTPRFKSYVEAEPAGGEIGAADGECPGADAANTSLHPDNISIPLLGAFLANRGTQSEKVKDKPLKVRKGGH